MKLVIVGGGSSYTPELIGGVAKYYNQLPISEVCLTDINPDRLTIMQGLSERMLKQKQAGCKNPACLLIN